MKAAIKNATFFKGNQGTGMNATLYVDGIKTADIHDDANGGMYNYRIFDEGKFAEFETIIKSFPAITIPSSDTPIEIDTDFFIDVLHHAQESKQFPEISLDDVEELEQEMRKIMMNDIQPQIEKNMARTVLDKGQNRKGN